MTTTLLSEILHNAQLAGSAADARCLSVQASDDAEVRIRKLDLRLNEEIRTREREVHPSQKESSSRD